MYCAFLVRAELLLSQCDFLLVVSFLKSTIYCDILIKGVHDFVMTRSKGSLLFNQEQKVPQAGTVRSISCYRWDLIMEGC